MRGGHGSANSSRNAWDPVSSSGLFAGKLPLPPRPLPLQKGAPLLGSPDLPAALL